MKKFYKKNISETDSIYLAKAQREYLELHKRMCAEASVTCCVSVEDDEQCKLLERIFGKKDVQKLIH